MLQEIQESLVPVFLLQDLLVLKETREMLGRQETRELGDLEAKKDKEELGRLGLSMCAGGKPRVPEALR